MHTLHEAYPHEVAGLGVGRKLWMTGEEILPADLGMVQNPGKLDMRFLQQSKEFSRANGLKMATLRLRTW